MTRISLLMSVALIVPLGAMAQDDVSGSAKPVAEAFAQARKAVSADDKARIDPAKPGAFGPKAVAVRAGEAVQGGDAAGAADAKTAEAEPAAEAPEEPHAAEAMTALVEPENVAPDTASREPASTETPEAARTVSEEMPNPSVGTVEDAPQAAETEPAAQAPDATETETAVGTAVEPDEAVDAEDTMTAQVPADEDASQAPTVAEAPGEEAPAAAPTAMAENQTRQAEQDVLPEDSETAEPGVVVAAPDPSPEPAPAPEPEPDPSIAACLSTGPSISAGVPTGKAEAAERRAALIAAIEPCTAAARLDEAPAEVLFLASEIAQGKRDVATAFALLERAAEMGLGAADTRAGDYHLFGVAPGGEDIDKAIARYQAATQKGDPAGMTTLALMHRVGKGVPRDVTRMVTLLQQAADMGYHFAQYRLAQTYLNGEGIPGRRDDALGIPDPARAARLYTAAAEAGNIAAALELAALYGDPQSGLPQDPEAQARLTLMASRAGMIEATAAMGVLYETGRGVTRNPEVAALLYVKALESGEVGFDVLRKGAPGGWDYDTAVAFQKILQSRGLYDGALDGVIGPGSRAGALALAGAKE